MGYIARLSVIGLGVLLAGCQGHYRQLGLVSSPYSFRIAACPGMSCAAIEIDMSGGCPKTDFDTIEFAGGRSQRTLTWKIVNGPDWRFSQDLAFAAIQFTTKNGAPIPFDRVGRAQFPGGDGKTLVVPWDRRGNGTGDVKLNSFDYVLNLVGANGATCTIDPWIVDK